MHLFLAVVKANCKNVLPFFPAFFLGLITIMVFYQLLGYDFINFDDPAYVTENTIVQEGLRLRGIQWAFASTQASNWHPVTWLSHMLDCQLYDLKPGGHHLTSILLHAANALLVYLFLLKATGQALPSIIAASLFAVHPLRVESVAWVAERKDVLCAFFMFLALHGYRWYTLRPSLWRYATAFFPFLLGLMAKPMLVSFPFIVFILDFWPLARQGALDGDARGPRAWRRLIAEKMPFLSVALAFGIVTFFVQKEAGAVKPLELIPLGLRIENALVTYVAYLQKMAWPTGLGVFYPYPDGISTARVAGAAGVLAGLSIFAWKSRKAHPYFLAGWMWYVISLVPVIGIVQVGLQAMADRYTYIPSVGICIMAAWGMTRLGLLFRRYLVVLAWVGIVLSLSLVAWFQAGYWRDSETLFTHTIEVSSRNFIAHNYLAQALAEKKQFGEAEKHFQEALKIKPRYSDAVVNLGVAYAEQGKYELGLQTLSSALLSGGDNAKVLNNLGNIYRGMGQLSEAVSFYKKAIGIYPEYREACFNLANTLEKLNLFDEAFSVYTSILDRYPRFAEAYNGLGVVLARNGKFRDAVPYFKQALQLRPDYLQAFENLKLAQANMN